MFFAALYSCTLNGFIANTDGETVYLVTRGIVEDKDVAIAPGLIQKVNGKVGKDGRIYSQYGIGQSLCAVPLYIAGRIAARGINESHREFVIRFAVASFNVFITALWCVAVFLLAALFYDSVRTRLIISLIGSSEF